MWLDCSQGITSAKFYDAISRNFPATLTFRDVHRFSASQRARTQARSVFELLAQAEAHAHGTTLDDVHFHEVGRLDNLTRVLGIFSALDMLGIDEWFATPPVIGNGVVHCSHGELDVPTPATRYLIEHYDIPITEVADRPIIGEFTTPTGVALLTQASGFLSEPPDNARVLRTRILP